MTMLTLYSAALPEYLLLSVAISIEVFTKEMCGFLEKDVVFAAVKV